MTEALAVVPDQEGTLAMLSMIKRHQDRFAGGVIATIGLAALSITRTYQIGDLRAMGPGFFPLILATLMVILGVLIAFSRDDAVPDAHEPDGLTSPEPRGWICIVAGVASFILLAKPAGMLPATFACVFIAAMGDRTSTWRASVVLAASVAVLGTLLFYYGLQIQLSPLNW